MPSSCRSRAHDAVVEQESVRPRCAVVVQESARANDAVVEQESGRPHGAAVEQQSVQASEGDALADIASLSQNALHHGQFYAMSGDVIDITIQIDAKDAHLPNRRGRDPTVKDWKLCCNKVKLSPWKGSMIHANVPLSSPPPTPPPAPLAPPPPSSPPPLPHFPPSLPPSLIPA